MTKQNSELIVNDDGSIYHLGILPEDLANDIIVVGDPGRVITISDRFDHIRVKKQNREFVTHTGTRNGKELTVLSTGIGTDNIDIVMNELDALVNFDLNKREEKAQKKSLRIIRLGTSGGLQTNIEIDSFLLSEFSVGMDGLLNYYSWLPNETENNLEKALNHHFQWPERYPLPYAVEADAELVQLLEKGMTKGITLTAGGFYAPQGRSLRLALPVADFHTQIQAFNWGGKKLTNFEMESAAIYGLGKLLGHKCCTVCAIIANRANGTFSKQHNATISRLIDDVLDKLTT